MKTLILECRSLGEAITRIRYNDSISMLDMHRACKVTVEIDTTSPLDPSYLHIGGPIPLDKDNVHETHPVETKDPKAKRPIGFMKVREPENEKKTE